MTAAEVIVIGAGAAGIGAARRLRSAGIDVTILEADSRPGGRCITDTVSLGQPFDRGGSWIHSAAVNPLAPLAQEYGFTIIEDQPKAVRAVAIGDRRLDTGARDAYALAMEALLGAEPPATDDPPMANFVPDSPWGTYVRHVIAALSGVDADACSSTDFHAFIEAPGEWLLAEGQGSLLARLGQGLPVRLDTPVTGIDYHSDPIRVQTPDGVLEAARVIVTVSTGALAAGHIHFTPELPSDLIDAIHGLPLGLLNKIGLAVRPDSVLADPDTVMAWHPSTDAAVMYRAGFTRRPVVCAFVGGRFADALEQDGPGAATAICREGLAALYGHDVLRDIERTTETAWRSHPFALGAYSTALPGAAGARSVLARGIDQRVLLAGEAVHDTLFSTVGGAWDSGIRAADRLIAGLGVRTVAS